MKFLILPAERNEFKDIISKNFLKKISDLNPPLKKKKKASRGNQSSSEKYAYKTKRFEFLPPVI